MENKNDFKDGIFILLITILVFGGLMSWEIPFRSESVWEEYEDFESDYELDNFDQIDYCEDDKFYHMVTVTKYNPVVEQCDSDPLITADGSFIDTLKLRKGDLKWIAISRDLRKDYSYGDTVIIESVSGEICGEYVVHDTMNPRWSFRIDILSPEGDSLGKWENVCMYKK